MNDGVMLESCVHRLIDLNFIEKECYRNIIKLMHEVNSWCKKFAALIH